jgi:hypothetical protein
MYNSLAVETRAFQITAGYAAGTENYFHLRVTKLDMISRNFFPCRGVTYLANGRSLGIQRGDVLTERHLAQNCEYFRFKTEAAVNAI